MLDHSPAEVELPQGPARRVKPESRPSIFAEGIGSPVPYGMARRLAAMASRAAGCRVMPIWLTPGSTSKVALGTSLANSGANCSAFMILSFAPTSTANDLPLRMARRRSEA